jgi:hypothetical protein
LDNATALLKASDLRVSQIPINWNSSLPIFASEAFLKTAGDEYGWLGGFDESDDLRCILPYTVVRKATFRMVRFRIETIHVGVDLPIQQEKTFLNRVVDHFRSIGADVIIPATTNTIFRTYPTGADVAPYGSYVVDLTQTEEALWSKLHSKHRNVIRNAMNKGVQVRTGIEHLDRAFDLVQETFKRSSMPFMSADAFKRTVVGLGENVRILIAEHDGVAQGCAVLPFSTYAAYYVYGGTAPKTLTGAMNFLQWEAMRLFQKLGVKRYDFVGVRIDPAKGSKQEGLQMFKERFGGQLMRGYMWKQPLRPFRAAAYSIAVRLLRGGDIVDVERTKMVNEVQPTKSNKVAEV